MKTGRRQILNRQSAVITLKLLTIIGASLPPFTIASCKARQRANSDSATLDNLRTLTRYSSLPSEADIARFEAAHANTTAGALARMIHARVRFNANDFKSAATLLDDKMF